MDQHCCPTLPWQFFKGGSFSVLVCRSFFHIDFFLKFQTTICQPGNHEAIQVENISIFLLSQPNTIFCATYFFSQSNGNVTYIQNFCSSSFLAFKVCLRRRRAWFFVTLSIVLSSLFLISYDLQTQKSNLRWELLDLPNVTLLISRSKKSPLASKFQLSFYFFFFSSSFSKLGWP